MIVVKGFEMKSKPKIGVSACLLGENVRYNRGHTQDKWLIRELGQYVDFYPFCPEVEMGLGVPREEIHLYYKDEDKEQLYLRSKFSRVELTDKAQETYQRMNGKMDKESLDGVVLMKKSPSCGLGNVKTVSEDENGSVKLLQGLYATNLEKNYPHLPKVDSGRFKNPTLREHFIKQVFAHWRFSQLENKISALQDFHKRYKYTLMEHDQDALRELGRICANHENRSPEEVFSDYKDKFFNAMSTLASVNNRVNTLYHIMGYVKNNLASDEKKHIIDLIEEFKEGIHTYMVPLRLLRFFIEKYNIEYLENHYYFTPYPKELKLHKDL